MTEPVVKPVGKLNLSLLIVYAGYALRYIYLIVLIPFYGRVLGTGSYGKLLAAMALFQVVWTFLDWGFPIAGTRDVAQSKSASEIAAHYGQQMSARFWLFMPAVLLGLASMLVSPVLAESPGLVALATINGVVAAFNMGWFFVGTMQFQKSVWIEVLGFAINLALILLLVHGPGDETVVMGSLVISSVVCTGVAHGLAIRSMRGQRIRVAGGLQLVKDTTTLFAFKGMSMMMTNSTSLVMSTFSRPVELGLYGAADRLVGAALSLLQPANQVLIAVVSRQMGSDDQRDSGYRTIRLSALALGGVGCLMTGVTLVAAELILHIVFGSGFLQSQSMLMVLSLLFPIMALSMVVNGYVLIPQRLDRASAVVSLVAAVTTVVLILWWGQVAGGMGVAWARVAGTLVMLCLGVAVMAKEGLLRQIFKRATG